MLGYKFYMECFCCVFFFILILVDSNGLFIDYTENTELIQQRAGYDITLKCGLKGLVDEDQIQNVKIYWYFKQCDENVATNGDCHDFHMDDWTKIPCEESFCKTDLILHNVTEKYSGLYKCTVFPHGLEKDIGHAPDIRFVRTYQLDVKNTSTPEFLDYPLNKTAQVGAQVVFQCRVYSEFPATIKWFRRIDGSDELSPGVRHRINSVNEKILNARILNYNGLTYELLPSAQEKFIKDDRSIYLSKLILNGITLNNEGYYACVAVSYCGHKVREAYLQVYANDEPDYWSEYDDELNEIQDPKEFWILFLIPFTLALIPFTIWSSYIVYKHCKRRSDIEKMNEEYFNEDLVIAQCMMRT